MNKHEAQRLVELELETTKDQYHSVDCIVLEEATISKPWGWVFFYQSKAYVETGESTAMLCGNSPVIVNRTTGGLVYTGTANDIDHCMAEYEASL